MHSEKVNVPSYIALQKLKLDSNAEFQKYQKREADPAFQKYTKKSWIQPKVDQRITREVIATLLASTQGDECVDDCIEKLLAEDISYNDLGSLTQTDLELMGIKDHKKQEEVLGFLKLLPNQDPSYNSILQTPEANNYNSKIFNSALTHLETMRSALLVANYKLKVMPADDVVVGEKCFASRFVLEALTELKGLTDEIDSQLLELDELVTGKKKNFRKNKVKHLTIALCFLITSVASGALAAIWFWKFPK